MAARKSILDNPRACRWCQRVNGPEIAQAVDTVGRMVREWACAYCGHANRTFQRAKYARPKAGRK